MAKLMLARTARILLSVVMIFMLPGMASAPDPVAASPRQVLSTDASIVFSGTAPNGKSVNSYVSVPHADALNPTDGAITRTAKGRRSTATAPFPAANGAMLPSATTAPTAAITSTAV